MDLRFLALAMVLVAGCEAASASLACPPYEAVNSQAPGRPYSQAVRSGAHVFFSGKVGVSETTSAMTEGRVEAETRNVMDSFGDLLSEMGMGFEDVVQGTVFLTDIDDYGPMNEVYGSYFSADPPARETVAVADIVGGAVIEISFIAGCR